MRVGQSCVELHYGTVLRNAIDLLFYWLLRGCAENWVRNRRKVDFHCRVIFRCVFVGK